NRTTPANVSQPGRLSYKVEDMTAIVRRRPPGRITSSVRPAFVLQKGDHGIGPVGDVVGPLGVADRLEALEQRVELLVAEPPPGLVPRGALGLRLACLAEADERLVAAGGLGELLEQLVDAPVALGRERRDGARDVLAVMVRRGHASPVPESPRSCCAGRAR